MSTISPSSQGQSPARPKALLRRLTSSHKRAKSASSTPSASSMTRQTSSTSSYLDAQPRIATTLSSVSPSTTTTTAQTPTGPDLSNLPLPLPTLVVGFGLFFLFALISRAFYTFSTSLLRGIVLLLTLGIGFVLLGGWEKRNGGAHSRQGSSVGASSTSATTGAGGSRLAPAYTSASTAAPPALAPPPLVNGNLVSPYSYNYQRSYSSY